VKCAFCGLILGQWKHGDIPDVEHKKHTPLCPFLLSGKDLRVCGKLIGLNRVGQPSSPGLTALYDLIGEKIDTIEALEEELEEIKIERRCSVCLVQQADVLILPCSHLVACKSCTDKIQNCAVCRVKITGRLQVFF
jgi:hypothetical protein